jgi:hypothetical protein
LFGQWEPNHPVEAVGRLQWDDWESLWESLMNTPGNKEYVKAFEELKVPASKQVYQQAFGYMGGQILEVAVKVVLDQAGETSITWLKHGHKRLSHWIRRILACKLV